MLQIFVVVVEGAAEEKKLRATRSGDAVRSREQEPNEALSGKKGGHERRGIMEIKGQASGSYKSQLGFSTDI